MSKDTFRPAFPVTAEQSASGAFASPGMSLRQWYAGQCPLTYSEVADMLGFTIHASTKPMSAHARKEFFDTWARLRLEYADAILTAEMGDE